MKEMVDLEKVQEIKMKMLDTIDDRFNGFHSQASWEGMKTHAEIIKNLSIAYEKICNAERMMK